MKQNKKFLRQCISCKTFKDKSDLIRITKEYTTGEIKLNNNSSIEGRSVYICKNSECVENAFKKKKIDILLKSESDDNLKETLYILLKN